MDKLISIATTGFHRYRNANEGKIRLEKLFIVFEFFNLVKILDKIGVVEV